MLLQPTNLKIYLNSHRENHHHVNFSSLTSNSLSFSSGFLQNTTFNLKQPIISTSYVSHKNPVSITCSSISKVDSYGTVDFEKRPTLKWSAIHKKISMLEDPNMGAASVLNQVEKGDKRLTKWELCRVVKELRKFRRYKYALQVYEWMNNRGEKYRMTMSDTAIQLDLIAKVHGISSAEKYFEKLPDALKDKRIYGSLLNAYVRSKMKEKAESTMDKMRNRGYASHALPFNVMMTLYMNLKLSEKIESLILEMKEKSVPFDTYTYNIWLSSSESSEKMEQVFHQMELDMNINPNWSTFCTMASLYIKFKEFDKAEESLRKIESRMARRDRMQYHYLISLYGSIGKKEDIYRIWDLYKATFVNIPNLGFHAMISSLIRTDDIEGAEKIYDEWFSIKTVYDPRVGNLLLGSYVKNGLSEKAQVFFDQMIKDGGKPNAVTWEILAEDRIKCGNIPEALSYLQNSASIEGAKSWKPKPINVSSILEIIEREGDVASNDVLFDVLRKVGCLDDEGYMSCVGVSDSDTFKGSVSDLEDRVESDGDNDRDNVLLGQLQESL